MVDIEQVRKDVNSVLFISDGSSGADKIARILKAVPELLDIAEAHDD